MLNSLKLLGLLLLVLSTQLIFGQTSKSYNGNFNSVNFRGTSSYHYYDDSSGQRIFQGLFSFGTVNGSVTINGNYQNDKKSGAWKVNLTNVANTDMIMKYSITANVSGAYNNGNLDGTWKLNRTKVISFSNNGISNYYKSALNGLSYLFDGKQIDYSKTATVTETAVANFKDNHFVGAFTDNVNNGKSQINGQFDEQGYFNGVWKVNYYSEGILHQLTKTYQSGVLISIKEKDNSTGVITTKFDASIDVTEFFQNYNPDENSAVVGGKYLRLVEDKSKNEDDEFLEDAISTWYNSTSLASSCYAFEIDRGNNKMSVYPQRKIEVNNEKMNQEANEKAAKVREEQRIKREKEQQEMAAENEKRQKINEFERSDFGKLQKKVKTDFQAWMEKGSYETNSDFETRIKTQSESKYAAIMAQRIQESQEKMGGKHKFAMIGDYNPENETYTLTWGKTETTTIKVSKEIAGDFNTAFKSKEQYGSSEIYIYPSKVAMVNNYWQVVEAIIVLNNYWFGSNGGGKLAATSVYKQNGSFYYNREENYYQTMQKEDKPHKMTDFNTVQHSSSLPREVFYLEMNNNNQPLQQSLNFSMSDLNIALPKF